MIVLNAPPVAHLRVELVFYRRFVDLSWRFSFVSGSHTYAWEAGVLHLAAAGKKSA
ncbi:hypothetical protein Pla52n_62230 [Stieleria varia]|uniref:Uncharacterized protein n=1 Tax=Stieleria varia TaxID=2528005 RepID=A0A5C5ZYJ6_9BACT|nr:hypothetical protein Pla52n_62230 [Stieleria varia]